MECEMLVLPKLVARVTNWNLIRKNALIFHYLRFINSQILLFTFNRINQRCHMLQNFRCNFCMSYILQTMKTLVRPLTLFFNNNIFLVLLELLHFTEKSFLCFVSMKKMIQVFIDNFIGNFTQ